MSATEPPVMLITGGTGSIGSEIAAQAAAEGWALAIHGSSQASVDKALKAGTERVPGARFTGHVADFGEAGAVQHLVEGAAAAHGRLDAVVDCAVTGPKGITGPFPDTDPAAFAALAELSVVAFQRLAHAALPWLTRSKGCLIAFVSDAGVFAAPRQAMIGTMRAATIGFVRNLALDVARDGVRIHAVSPSYVEETAVAARLEATSLERLEQARRRAGLGLPTPADIAPLVLFLCGPGAKRLTGQVISVNGGLNA